MCHLLLLVALLISSDALATDTFSPRRPGHDIGRGIWVLARDAWAYVTSPTRLDRESALTTGKVLAVGGLLFAFDEEIQDFFLRNRNGFVLEQSEQLGETFGKLGLKGPTTQYYVGAIVVGYAIDQPWMLRIGAEILEAQYFAGFVRSASIALIGRYRPKDGYGAYEFDPGEGDSFPSGHALNIWGLSEILRLHIDRWWATTALYTIATSVSLQRIQSDSHWASDVWIGSALGISAARFAYGRHEGGDALSSRVGPVLAPDGTPGLGYARRF